MYECYGYVNGQWLRGFECGSRASDNLVCFVPNGSRETYWLPKEYISYEDGA